MECVVGKAIGRVREVIGDRVVEVRVVGVANEKVGQNLSEK